MVVRIIWKILLAIILLPLIAITITSVVQQWQYPALIDSQFSLRAWYDFFRQPGIFTEILASFLNSTIVAILATLFGFETSRRIANSNNSWLVLAFFPYLLAPVVLASIWQVYFIRAGLSGSWFGVGIGQFLFIYPYAVLFLSGFWNREVLSMGEEASTLGASERNIYRELWIPLAKPFLITCVVQCFLISWFDYGLTQMLGLGKVRTFTVQTMKFIQESDFHLAAVSALLLTVPVLFMLLWKGKLFTERPFDQNS